MYVETAAVCSVPWTEVFPTSVQSFNFVPLMENSLRRGPRVRLPAPNLHCAELDLPVRARHMNSQLAWFQSSFHVVALFSVTPLDLAVASLHLRPCCLLLLLAGAARCCCQLLTDTPWASPRVVSYLVTGNTTSSMCRLPTVGMALLDCPALLPSNNGHN